MKLLILIIALFFFVGCSGKVQTNPLPDNKKFYLPDTEKKIVPKSESQAFYGDDFDRYARKVLNISDLPNTQEENIDIFSIGYAKEKMKK